MLCSVATQNGCVMASCASDPKCPVCHMLHLLPQASRCPQEGTRGLATRQPSLLSERRSKPPLSSLCLCLITLSLIQKGSKAASSLSKHSLCLLEVLTVTVEISATQNSRSRASPAAGESAKLRGRGSLGTGLQRGVNREEEKVGKPEPADWQGQMHRHKGERDKGETKLVGASEEK